MPLNKKRKAAKAAFPHTIPVLTGFTFLGIAFGILMNSKGYGTLWAVLMSLIVFAGSAQYVAITFLTTAFNPVYALLITMMINARHLFYGISMLEKYKEIGGLKPYLIFGLCDESFSIICSTNPPEGVDRQWFYFFITFLDHCYWVIGTAIGGVLGSMITMNTKGLDFVLTALFVVIFMGQWKSQSPNTSAGWRHNLKTHIPAITGVACSFLCLLVFGKGNFMIPSMIAILAVLTLMQKKQAGDRIDENVEEETR